MKKRSTKEIKLQAKKSLQGHVGTVILGLLAVYGLNHNANGYGHNFQENQILLHYTFHYSNHTVHPIDH